MRQMIATMVVALGAGLMMPGESAAQDPGVPAPEQSIEVTEELLERFVAVYPSVLQVAQDAQTRMATAETPEQAQTIQAEAQAAVAELLEEGELAPVEYEAVVRELNEDPELMMEFERMLEEQEGEPQEGEPQG